MFVVSGEGKKKEKGEEGEGWTESVSVVCGEERLCEGNHTVPEGQPEKK